MRINKLRCSDLLSNSTLIEKSMTQEEKMRGSKISDMESESGFRNMISTMMILMIELVREYWNFIIAKIGL